MKISQIYDKYKIMPNLQLHQLRVAAVASIIIDNFDRKLDKNLIISACLLHDMGNIIKFKLDLFPEDLQPHGLNYWQDVKKEFINKYGSDEHSATSKIAEEIGVDERVRKIIKAYGFSKAKQTLSNKNYHVKISVYSDHRVSPNGIASLKKRQDGAIQRNLDNKNSIPDMARIEELRDCWTRIEEQIFARCGIAASDITDEKVKPLVVKYRSFEFGTQF